MFKRLLNAFTITLVGFLIAATAHANINFVAYTNSFPVPLTIDWSTWDGTEDSAEGHFCDSGFCGPPSMDVINRTDMLAAIRHRASPEKRSMYRLRRVGDDTLNVVGTLDLSIADEGVQSSVAVFNENYALGVFSTNTVHNNFLIDISGDTPVELDAVDRSAATGNDCKGGYTRVNDNYVAGWCPDLTEETFTVGRAGDVLTYSSAASISGSTSSNAFAFGWDNDTYIGITTEDIFAFDIDGSGNPTQVATQTINTDEAFSYFSIHGAFKAYDDRIVVIGQTSASTDYLGCEVFSFNGTKLTSVFSNNELISGVLYWVTPPVGKVAKTGTSTGILVGTDQNGVNAFTQTEGRVITLSEADTCEIKDKVDLVGGDHVVVERLTGENGRYAIALAQDPGTTPEDKISFKILDGKGEAAGGGGGGSCTAMTGASLDISFSCDESYAGTGTTVTDLAGNTNFTLVGNPAFTEGYIQTDGTDDYLDADTIPDTDIYKSTGGDFLAAMLFETPSGYSTNAMAFAFDDGTSSIDDFIRMGFFPSSGVIRTQHRTSSTFFNGNNAATSAAASTVYCLVKVIDQSTAATTWYINSTTADTADDGSFAYGGTVPDAASFQIGANGAAGQLFGNGVKIYEARFDFDITAGNITGTDIQTIYDTWNARVGSNICPTS